MNSKKMKTIIGLVLAVAIMVISQVISLPDGVTREGLSALGIFLAAIVMWITESLPMCVTTFVFMALIPYFGIMEMEEVWISFGGSSFFFVIATFAITMAITKTSIPLRISCKLLQWSKGNSTKLVLGFMFACAITSSVMSNISTCILYLGLVMALLKANHCEPGKSNLGKCLMITIPATAGIGGLITPAGTVSNVMVIDMLANAGITVTFLQWTLICAPLALLTVFICGIWITRIFKPEPITAEAINAIKNKKEEAGTLTGQEKKAITIVLLMIVLWISPLNTTVVALLGMALLFFPGIEVLSWKDYSKETNWNIIFAIGSIGVLISGLTKTGIMDWIVNTAFSGISGWNTFALFLFVGLIVCIIRAFVPTAPAIIALFGVPLLSIASMTGYSAVALLIIPAFWACAPMLLWFEPIFLFSYGEGYYRPLDVLKYGSVPSILLIPLIALILPPFVGIFGF